MPASLLVAGLTRCRGCGLATRTQVILGSRDSAVTEEKTNTCPSPVRQALNSRLTPPRGTVSPHLTSSIGSVTLSETTSKEASFITGSQIRTRVKFLWHLADIMTKRRCPRRTCRTEQDVAPSHAAAEWLGRDIASMRRSLDSSPHLPGPKFPP